MGGSIIGTIQFTNIMMQKSMVEVWWANENVILHTWEWVVCLLWYLKWSNTYLESLIWITETLICCSLFRAKRPWISHSKQDVQTLPFVAQIFALTNKQWCPKDTYQWAITQIVLFRMSWKRNLAILYSFCISF